MKKKKTKVFFYSGAARGTRGRCEPISMVLAWQRSRKIRWVLSFSHSAYSLLSLHLFSLYSLLFSFSFFLLPSLYVGITEPRIQRPKQGPFAFTGLSALHSKFFLVCQLPFDFVSSCCKFISVSTTSWSSSYDRPVKFINSTFTGDKNPLGRCKWMENQKIHFVFAAFAYLGEFGEKGWKLQCTRSKRSRVSRKMKETTKQGRCTSAGSRRARRRWFKAEIRHVTNSDFMIIYSMGFYKYGSVCILWESQINEECKKKNRIYDSLAVSLFKGTSFSSRTFSSDPETTVRHRWYR